MKQSKWAVRLVAAGLAALPLMGAALATGQQGSQSDPLVTLSYLTEKAEPSILAQVDAKLAQQQSDLTAKLNQVADSYIRQVEDRLNSGGSIASPSGAASAYIVVNLAQGQELVGTAACEFLLRSGSAVCVSSSAPGLIDMTAGTALSSGGALVQNHLYLGTIDGRGVRAATAVTLMVRGDYMIN